jgi:fibronectin type 3 domain-containing protein
MIRRFPYPLLLFLLLGACRREELQPVQPDTIPPLPPAGMSLDAAHDGLIMFSWLRNTENDIDGYIVYRREPATATFEAIDTTTNHYFIDAQRSYDTTYDYYTVALDRSGNFSIPSVVLSANSPNRYVPEAPDVVYANGHNQDGRRYFRIEWPPVEEADISGYAVYAAGTKDLKAEPQYLLANTNATFLLDSSQAAFNQVRYYAVTAIDRGGRVSPLSPVTWDYITQAPELTMPADMERINDYPVFAWNHVPGAVQYRLSVMGSDAGDEIWVSYVDDAGSSKLYAVYAGIPLYTGKIYFWRVATLTQREGDVNAVSPMRAFQMVP